MSFQLKAQKYDWRYLLKLPFECQPFCTIFVVFQKVFGSVVTVLWIFVEAKFIDTALTVARGDMQRSAAYPWLICMVLIIVWKRMGYSLGRIATRKLEVESEAQLTEEAVKKRSRLHFSLIEDKEAWELVSRVSGQITKNTWYTLQQTCNFLGYVVRLLGTFLILFRQLWWLGLLMLGASCLLIGISMKGGTKVYNAYKRAAAYQRRSEYLGEVLTSRETANERTLFQFSDKLDKVWADQRDEMNRINLKAIGEKEGMVVKGSLLTTAISTVMIILLSFGLRSRLTIGMFIALAKAILDVVNIMSHEVPHAVVKMSNCLGYLKDLTEFANMEETEGTNELPAAGPVPFESLEFKNVTFTYPGASEPIFKNLSLRIERGKHYAFVGENGAGKTTLTKLATRLYDRYEGEILLNGRELSTYTIPEIKAVFTGVYQDYAQYSIPVRDNIQLGNIRKMGSEEAEQKMYSITEKLGLHREIESLPMGYDTPLGRLTPESVDMSGGQWQRIAMARSLMSDAPVQILDEPTAALDPISESRLYEQFGEISRGKTTVFISHRLGSTKLADHIFVLKGGKILEEGSHDRLMEQHGLYAQMYESQRSWYQDSELRGE